MTDIPSPYVQASELETPKVLQPQVARPVPTPPSTQPLKTASLSQELKKFAAPVVGAAAAAAGVQAQKVLAAKCPHCQAFVAQTQKNGWRDSLNNVTRAIVPIAQNAAAKQLNQWKSQVGMLSFLNKVA